MTLRCKACGDDRPNPIGKTVSWVCACGTANKINWDTKFVYVCHKCGEENKAWARAQRHADSHGGARIDLRLA